MTFTYVKKCVTIRSDQDEFIQTENEFKLSRFVQAELDKWIADRKKMKNFIKEVVE